MRTVILAALVLTTAGAVGAQERSDDSVRQRVLEARHLAGRGEHRQAAAILERTLMMAPNSEEVLRDFAHNSLAIKDPVGAMGALEPLTRMHPDHPEYPYLMGVAQLQVAGVGLAVESLEHSLRLGQLVAVLLVQNIAEIDLVVGHCTFGILEHSLRLDPNRALTMIALGFAYNAQKKYDLAKEVIARSLILEPEEVEALAAMAEAEEGLGEIEQAEYYAERALARAPSHHAALYILGKVRMSQGRFEEARDLFLRAVATRPSTS